MKTKLSTSKTGSVRIIGGAWRGSVITFTPSEGLRPTPDRVRETLFNWLGQDLAGLRVLDAYAGTGALGLEAASRGAAQVIALDVNAGVVSTIAGHALRLGGANVHALRADALSWIANTSDRFDVIFLDPPFSANFYGKLAQIAPQVLTENGFLYVEAPNHLTEFGALVLRKTVRAGAVHAHLFQKTIAA